MEERGPTCQACLTQHPLILAPMCRNLINSFGLNVLDPDVLKDQVNT